MTTKTSTANEKMNRDYPQAWYEGKIQARIRQLAHYTCEICGMHFDPITNIALDARTEDDQPIYGHVHHLDHCPPNCEDANLIFLCQTCHIRLHGLDWKPGDIMPLSWGNEPPNWVLTRHLPYQFNSAVRSLHESARYLADKQERAHFISQLIDQQGWISGHYDPLSEMRGFLKLVLNDYEALLDERTRAAQQPILAQAQRWAAEQHVVPYAEAMSLSGLCQQDFDTAVERGYIPRAVCPYDDPSLPAYFDPGKLILPSETIKAMWATMRLTRQQAAETLGLSVSFFERKRRQAGIKPFPMNRYDSRQNEPLYRKSDVEKLRT